MTPTDMRARADREEPGLAAMLRAGADAMEECEALKTDVRTYQDIVQDMTLLTANKDAAHQRARDNLARAEAAEARVAALTAELAEARRQLGGGCDANDGSDHAVITQGTYHFCAKCGESLRGVRFCRLPRAKGPTS